MKLGYMYLEKCGIREEDNNGEEVKERTIMSVTINEYSPRRNKTWRSRCRKLWFMYDKRHEKKRRYLVTNCVVLLLPDYVALLTINNNRDYSWHNKLQKISTICFSAWRNIFVFISLNAAGDWPNLCITYIMRPLFLIFIYSLIK